MPPPRQLIGVGIDGVSWRRIRRFLNQHSFGFLRRLLTSNEQTTFRKTSDPVQFFARSFAAKEAYFKACGGSLMGEWGFREIDVVLRNPDEFSVSGDLGTEGKFFETPDGIAARVLVWR